MNKQLPQIGHSSSRPGEAIMGIGYEQLITSAATNGQYELMKFVVPKGLGPPMHMHTREDECYYIINGTFEMTVGEERINAASGTYLHLPRHIPHGIRNLGEEMGSFLCWVIPGNLGPFFDHFKKPWPENELYPPMLTGEDIKEMMKTANSYGIEVLTK